MLDAGAWYHVVNRGNNRQRVFKDTRDHEHFLEILAKGCASFKVELHAYGGGNWCHAFTIDNYCLTNRSGFSLGATGTMNLMDGRYNA